MKSLKLNLPNLMKLKRSRSTFVSVIPWLLLGLSLAASVFVWWQQEQIIEAESQNQLEKAIQRTRTFITVRLNNYEDALRGAQGLFAANLDGEVSQAEWQRYVASLSIEQRLPGIYGLGYIAYVPGQDLNNFIKARQADNAPNFNYKPAGVRSDYFITKYIEPIAQNGPTLGFDIGTEPARRQAAEQARDTGQATLTGKITLLQDSKQQPAFLLLLPVYRSGAPISTVEERRSALKGWVCEPFRAGDLLGDIFQNSNDTNTTSARANNKAVDLSQSYQLDFEVYDGPDAPSAANLLYDTDGVLHGIEDDQAITKSLTIQVKGRDWTLHFIALPTFEATLYRIGPFLILVAGLLLSLMLFGFTWRLSRARSNALKLAQQELLERQQTQQALQESQTNLQDFFDNASDLIQSVSPEGRYLYVNQSWLQTLGYTQAELDALSMWNIIHPDSLAACLEKFKLVISGESLTRVEATFVAKDGRLIVVEGNCNCRFNDGRPEAIRSIFRDITERKRTEEALAEAHDQALAASRLKTEFLANMSHEIRTPISSIVGVSELLADTSLSQEQNDFNQIIHKSAQSLMLLLNDILDLSIIEANKLSLEISAFEFQKLVEESVQPLAPQAHEKDLALVTYFDPALRGYWRGDPFRLRQILTNLLNNAIKFTKNGRIEVRVSPETAVTSPLAENGSAGADETVQVRFAVSDSGIGLSEATRQRLFQPFTQADGSTSRKYGGLGLGLAISKRLVELMDGQIGVESIEGQGSTFWFTLPLTVAEGVASADPDYGAAVSLSQTYLSASTSDELESSFVADSSFKKGVILLAEDNPVNQKLGLAQLRKLGYNAHAVSNGRELLEKLGRASLNASLSSDPKAENYALILMDCQMPELDGFETTSIIRQKERLAGQTRHIPIIALTANAMLGDKETCLAAGMDDYLTKPINLEELAKRLEHWLNFAKNRTSPIPVPVTLVKEKEEAEVLLDLTDLLESLGLDADPGAGDLPEEMEEVLVELVELFGKNGRKLLLTLEETLTHQDSQQFYRAAHTLKGSSANLGAVKMAKLCLELEMIGRKGFCPEGGSFQHIAEKLQQLEFHFEQTEQALRKAIIKVAK